MKNNNWRWEVANNRNQGTFDNSDHFSCLVLKYESHMRVNYNLQYSHLRMWCDLTHFIFTSLQSVKDMVKHVYLVDNRKCRIFFVSVYISG